MSTSFALARRPACSTQAGGKHLVTSLPAWSAPSAWAPDRSEAGNIDDTRLVAAAKYGDPDAFDALVMRYTPVLHAVARRLVGNDLASDVVQDSLMAAFRNLGKYRGDASFGTYLHGIVVNRCRRVGKRWSRPTLPSDALEDAAGNESGPAEVTESNDTYRLLEEAVLRLPLAYREALTLREFGGLGYEEVAEVLGVPMGTVRSRLARARAMLRDELSRVGVAP